MPPGERDRERLTEEPRSAWIMIGMAADLVLLAHAGFAVFVVFGGLLVARWPRLAWAHLPAAAWGALVEFAGWICPLTPLEQSLRLRAGESSYSGDFIAHYVVPVLYPAGLTRPVQVVLGALVVGVNAAVYWTLVRRARRRGSATGS